MTTNNRIQKAVDVGTGIVVLLIVAVGAAVAFGRGPAPGHLLPSAAPVGVERMTYSPGALMCPVGRGPVWEELMAMSDRTSLPLLAGRNIRK